MDGARVGVAHHGLSRFTAETAVELSTLYGLTRHKGEGDASPEDAARKAGLWLLQHDIAGYILLGDPAVRLPLAEKKAEAPKEEIIEAAASLLGFAPQPEIGRATALDVDAMEEAALALLTRRGDEGALAQKHGVSPSDLLRWAEVYRQAGREALSKLPK